MKSTGWPLTSTHSGSVKLLYPADEAAHHFQNIGTEDVKFASPADQSVEADGSWPLGDEAGRPTSSEPSAAAALDCLELARARWREPGPWHASHDTSTSVQRVA